MFQSELKEIFKAYPNHFDEEETYDAEFNTLGLNLIIILAMYIFMERKKEEGSFYKPYFDVV